MSKNDVIILVKLHIVLFRYSIASQTSATIVTIILKAIQFKLSNLTIWYSVSLASQSL